MDKKEEKNYSKYKYEIVKSIGFDNQGELFLINYKNNDTKNNELYVMEKIEFKTEKEKNIIKNKIEIIKNIESNYIIKIHDLFFETENGHNFAFIIMEYCQKGNLYNIMYETNYLNERTIWRIFIQLAQGFRTLNTSNIILKYISPKNIFIDKNNNIKIGGIYNIFEFKGENLLNEFNDLTCYIAPEILYNLPYSKDKCVVWSLGCILYELVFKKRAFEYEPDKNDILTRKFEITDNCEKDFQDIIPKLLCKESKRMTINDLIFEGTFKRKVIEINMFDEIIKDKIQCKYIIFKYNLNI